MTMQAGVPKLVRPDTGLRPRRIGLTPNTTGAQVVICDGMSDEERRGISARNGWDDSARAWIEDMGEHGDFGRRYVLDPAMRDRLGGRGFQRALDIGCGEGRVCRLLAGLGVAAVGFDPTRALLDRARELDPSGHSLEGVAESLPFPDESFDLVVSCLSLIDIDDFETAIQEMARVTIPGGTVYIVNLSGLATAQSEPVLPRAPGDISVRVERYLETRSSWQAWRGIRVLNWHRPLSAYMDAFLGSGLLLRHYAEPAPVDGEVSKVERYISIPWYVVMEWEKPTH